MDMATIIVQRAKNLGYANVGAFFENNPGIPYGVLLKKISVPVESGRHLDIPILVLKMVHRQNAIETGRIREYAIDTMVRSLTEHLGSGWNAGRNSKERRAAAYANWSTVPEFNSHFEKVWRALESLNPPDRWRPDAVADPIIERAFEIGWPQHNVDEN
jgi:hypothetical protein